MRLARNKSGSMVIQTLIAVGIMGFIASGALALMIASAACFDDTSTEAFTDVDATIAMRRMVSDVREAKSVVISNGEILEIVFPVRTENGYYDRHESDLTNSVTYYLSDATGEIRNDGTYLWRDQGGIGRQIVKRDVTNLGFEQDTSRSITISISTQNTAATETKTTQLTERVVYMRNY